MSETGSARRWRLTVWFESPGEFTTFDFDGEPTEGSGAKVVTYSGEHEGHAVRVNVSMDRASAWRLAEVTR